MKEIIESRTLKIIALSLAGLVVVFGSFAAGVGVGLHKAKFSYRFGENYEKNFLEGRPMMPMNRLLDGRGEKNSFPPSFENMEGRGFRNAHGLAGEIISISDNNLVIKDKDDKENSVELSEKTIIKSGRETINKSALQSGDEIAVIGNPNDSGVVVADLIRIFNQK